MNIFHKAALKSMKENRTRTVVTVIGVVLSSAMITGIAVSITSLQNYLVNSSIRKYGNWHVEFLDVDASFIQEQKKDKRVENTAAIKNIGYGMLEGGENPDKPYLFVAGLGRDAFHTLPIDLVSGRMPENDSEVLVPTHVAANGGVSILVGDTISLKTGERMDGKKKLCQHDPYISGEETGTTREKLTEREEKTYTVVGICQRPSFEEYTSPGYTLITVMDEKEETGSFSVFVTLKEPYRVRSYAGTAAENHSYVFNEDVLRYMGNSDNKSFQALLYLIGGLLTALIMLGSFFLIYNSFAISMNDRMREFGILLSVGATQRQLKNSVLFEGVVIGAVGIPLGILSAIPSVELILFATTKIFANSIMKEGDALTLHMSFPVLLAAAAGCMITILFSAYIPVRKAVSVPVLECIRQTNEVKLAEKTVKTPAFLERISGLEGVLALKNFKQNKTRYRSIVFSLSLSVVLFISVNVFSGYLEQVVEGTQAMEAEAYDLCFCTQNMTEEKLFRLYDQMKNTDGVLQSSYQACTAYVCHTDVRDLTDECKEQLGIDGKDQTAELFFDVQFVEERMFSELLEDSGLPEEEYTREGGKLVAVAKGEGMRGAMFKQPSVKLTAAAKNGSGKKEVELTFIDKGTVNIFPQRNFEMTPYTFQVTAPYQRKTEFDFLGAPVKQGFTFRSEKPSQSERDMKTLIADAGITEEYTLTNLYRVMEMGRNMVFVAELFAAVFIIMISLIATANVFNTISTNIRLRRRELAMLRSVGMPERSFNRMICFECALYGFRTILYGLPAAGLLSYLIYIVFVLSEGEEFTYTIPWGSIGICIAGVFLVIFVTMLYAVNKIKKENIIDALRDDII